MPVFPYCLGHTIFGTVEIIQIVSMRSFWASYRTVGKRRYTWEKFHCFSRILELVGTRPRYVDWPFLVTFRVSGRTTEKCPSRTRANCYKSSRQTESHSSTICPNSKAKFTILKGVICERLAPTEMPSRSVAKLVSNITRWYYEECAPTIVSRISRMLKLCRDNSTKSLTPLDTIRDKSYIYTVLFIKSEHFSHFIPVFGYGSIPADVGNLFIFTILGSSYFGLI